MSPNISSLFEEAADDDGRPVRTDFDAIKAQGRRALVRRRIATGASGLAVAAVIGSVALASGALDLGRGHNATDVASGTGDISRPSGEGEGTTGGFGCAWSIGEAGEAGFVDGAPADPNMTEYIGEPGSKPSYIGKFPAGGGAGTFGSGQGAPNTATTVTSGPGEASAEPPPDFVTPPPPDGGTVEGGIEGDELADCAGSPSLDTKPVEAALIAAGYTVGSILGTATMNDDGVGYTTTTLQVLDADGNVGTVVVGSFTSLDAAQHEGDDPDAPWCGPEVSMASDFVWDACDPAPGDTTITPGHDSFADVLGALLVRDDGFVVGISASPATFDRDESGAPTAPTLTGLPLDSDQLSELLDAVAASMTTGGPTEVPTQAP